MAFPSVLVVGFASFHLKPLVSCCTDVGKLLTDTYGAEPSNTSRSLPVIPVVTLSEIALNTLVKSSVSLESYALSRLVAILPFKNSETVGPSSYALSFAAP